MVHFTQDIFSFLQKEMTQAITQKDIELFLAVKGKEFLINKKPTKVNIIIIIDFILFNFFYFILI